MQTHKPIVERLYILRHGPYEGRGFLTEEGRQQMEKVAALIEADCGLTMMETSLLCSPALRAIKTAQVITRICGIEEEVHNELRSDDQVCDTPAALDVIASYMGAARNLIIVTHMEMAQALPSAFGERFMNGAVFPSAPVNHAEGIMINIGERGYRFLSCHGFESPLRPAQLA